MQNITDNFPDISFIDDTTVDQVLTQMINDYQEKYKEITKKEVSLAQADPYRLIMYAATMQIYQGMQYADYAGKMSFLKYSRDDYLDNLAALRGVKRNEATAATTDLKFSVESAVSSTVSIPAGCMVTNGNDVYFSTNEYAEIPAGSTEVIVPATCTEAGSLGNNFEIGELNIIVNTLPYVVAVTNTTKTYGGADRETDDSLKDRVFHAPNSYSTAGPAGAYEYYAKLSDPTISDVVTKSPSPGSVDVYIICNGGTIPDTSMIHKVESFLQTRTIRPLTDNVTVKAPTEDVYNVEFTYYIPSSSKSAVETIQADVNTAVSIYNSWQTEKIGRDINPSYLIQKIMQAGAKRVEVSAPVFKVLDDSTIAKTGAVTITYGGVEDD